jgi:hypothetical protein
VKTDPIWLAGDRLLYSVDRANFAVQDLASGKVESHRGAQVATSADGSAIAFVRQEDGMNMITVQRFGTAAGSRDAVRRREQVQAPALSRDGSKLTFQVMPREDWEVYVADVASGDEKRLTREIQHDLMPRFVNDNTVLAVMGEGRHRRSYLYDVASGERTRLFHNNTVRTVSPEYDWVLSPDASRVLIVAERDGDTVSPERGVYLLDLTRKLPVDDVRARVRAQLAHETALRERGAKVFAAIEPQVRATVADVTKDRVYRYSYDLYQFDSKYITQPGNAKAIEYIAAKLREFGYEPELQWFEPAPGVRSANVVATLRGTADPEVQYVVGSHFDSVQEGPGSDDNTSGTAALLEVARVLARRPQAATIRFVWFTSEESGLRGSREYVRLALEAGDRVVGALNNDMVGWANDDRLDNTIRYANRGLRDLQHAAAFLFTDLITYDAHYYKFTDAHSLVDGFGDVVAGIGSYPVLGNPHYHQPHDVLETVNHRLVAAVSRTTLASVVLMASSPSRVAEVSASRQAGGAVVVRWKPAIERGVTTYRIGWEDVNGKTGGRRIVRGSAARLVGVPPRATIAVRAIGARGLEGWDWGRATLAD